MKHSKSIAVAALLLVATESALAWSMNPDGTYGPDDTLSYMTPNGSFQPGTSSTMNPDGSFTDSYDRQERQSSPTYMNPDRSFGYENDSLRPDGSYGSPNSELTPHGYVNRY